MTEGLEGIAGLLGLEFGRGELERSCWWAVGKAKGLWLLCRF